MAATGEWMPNIDGLAPVRHTPAPARRSWRTNMATAGIDWRTGAPVTVYDLEQPRFQGMPIHEAHQPGYLYVLHRRHADGYDPVRNGPRTGASGVIVCMEHSGTHIDAVSHQADAQVLAGGIDANAVATAKGYRQGGVEEI